MTEQTCRWRGAVVPLACGLLVALATTLHAGVPDAAKVRGQLDALEEVIMPALKAPDGVGAGTLRGQDALRARAEDWKVQLLALARAPLDWTTVEYADRDMRALMDMIFQSFSDDPSAQQALIAELTASPMQALREYGEAKRRLDRLRGQPWDLQFTAMDGREVSLAALRGKPVIVAYWSAGCVGSRRQIEKLRTLYQRHHPEGLEIIGLNFDKEEERADTERFALEQGLVWPHRVDRQQRLEEFERFGLVWVSNILLFDTQGRLLRVAPGPDLDEWDGLIRQQLAGGHTQEMP